MMKLIKPYINFEDVESEFREIFESGWFTKGKYVDSLRKEICEYTGSSYAFLTTSATTALTMCLRLLEIGPGDEVVVSDFSFPATANVVVDVGATPIFADVDPLTFNMTRETLERKLTPKTKAVIFVDALGNPTGLHSIKALCEERNLILIEDAACAIGSEERKRRCGNIADLTCFSFHPRKLLTTGEGGAITTNNAEYAHRLEIKLNHGSIQKDGKFDFVDFGYNYRLPELQAVMAIKQIRKLNDIVAERNRIRSVYRARLENLGFRAQVTGPDVVFNVQSLVFTVPESMSRDRLIADLKAREIETTLGTYSQSGTTFYKKTFDDVQPNSWRLQNTTITFPCYQGADVERVCDAVTEIQKA